MKAVFFVEALCAYALGDDILKRIVAPILDAGQEVQLHLHPEWLHAMSIDPTDGRRGIHIGSFDATDQERLIEMGVEALSRVGAPVPTAFRAGNFGADARTLEALRRLGIRFDSSHNAAMPAQAQLVALAPEGQGLLQLNGIDEIPVTCFEDRPGHLRPLQLCAVSSAEMRHVLGQTRRQSRPFAVIVSHSFELLNGKRERPSRLVVSRFASMCEHLADRRDLMPTAGFGDLAQDTSSQPVFPRIRPGAMSTGFRILQQGLARYLD